MRKENDAVSLQGFKGKGFTRERWGQGPLRTGLLFHKHQPSTTACQVRVRRQWFRKNNPGGALVDLFRDETWWRDFALPSPMPLVDFNPHEIMVLLLIHPICCMSVLNKPRSAIWVIRCCGAVCAGAKMTITYNWKWRFGTILPWWVGISHHLGLR